MNLHGKFDYACCQGKEELEEIEYMEIACDSLHATDVAKHVNVLTKPNMLDG